MTQIYTLSLHDALPICASQEAGVDEHLEVVRHGRLRQVERLVQVAHAGLAALAGRDHREQAKPCRFADRLEARDRKSTRLNSSHGYISYAVFCLKKKTH